MRFAWVGDYSAPNTFLDIFRSADEQDIVLNDYPIAPLYFYAGRFLFRKGRN